MRCADCARPATTSELQMMMHSVAQTFIAHQRRPHQFLLHIKNDGALLAVLCAFAVAFVSVCASTRKTDLLGVFFVFACLSRFIFFVCVCHGGKIIIYLFRAFFCSLSTAVSQPAINHQQHQQQLHVYEKKKQRTNRKKNSLARTRDFIVQKCWLIVG